MKLIQQLLLILLGAFIIYYVAFDNYQDPGQVRNCDCPKEKEISNPNQYPPIKEALLASRINSLEAFKSIVQIEYSNSMVRLRHCSNDREVTSVLKTGISQGQIYEVMAGNVIGKVWFLLKSPFAVANRGDLFKIFNLARRKPYTYGEGDVAFYDLAEGMVDHISTKKLAYLHPKDSTETGYINTFNHIIAQSFMTACFSESMADFVSDVHERHNMLELISGKFTEEQLTDPQKNPVDNYVDMINNECGQEMGERLREKYNISSTSIWTPELLTNYLNDLQVYFSDVFQIGFMPFSVDDRVVIRFVGKINLVMSE